MGLGDLRQNLLVWPKKKQRKHRILDLKAERPWPKLRLWGHSIDRVIKFEFK
jgi:hypothetical protein